MHEKMGGDPVPPGNEYSNTEGIALALSYVENPADIHCPSCGPETMEVVAFLSASGIDKGVIRATDPEGEYTVVIYCHECRRAAALDLRGVAGSGEQDEYE